MQQSAWCRGEKCACVAEPAEYRQYKPLTTFPLYSLSLAVALLQATRVLYKFDYCKILCYWSQKKHKSAAQPKICA